MDKFVKENKISVTIIIILLIATGLYYTNKQSVKTEDNLTLQIKCSDAAGKYFTSKGYKISDGSDYKNHYNPQLNKCFILITSYITNDDFLTIDLYDAVEGRHYAEYDGHSVCDFKSLAITNQKPNKCMLDHGNIWFDGNDTKNPADFHVGFQGLSVGPGVGDENTKKDFISHVQLFMNGQSN